MHNVGDIIRLNNCEIVIKVLTVQPGDQQTIHEYKGITRYGVEINGVKETISSDLLVILEASQIKHNKNGGKKK